MPARAVTPDDLPDRLERVAIAVKSHHTAQAAELLRDRLAPDGYLVSFQNGLTADTLSAAVGARPAPRQLRELRRGRPRARPRSCRATSARSGSASWTGEITPRLRELAEALPYAEATGNIMGFLWGKEAYGAMLYAGAVSDLSIADSLEDPQWRPLMLGIAREVLAQAPVEPEGVRRLRPRRPGGLAGPAGHLQPGQRQVATAASTATSMVRKRKTEVDDLLNDLAGPLTTYTGEIIKAIERGERTCEVANLELLAAYERPSGSAGR